MKKTVNMVKEKNKYIANKVGTLVGGAKQTFKNLWKTVGKKKAQ